MRCETGSHRKLVDCINHLRMIITDSTLVLKSRHKIECCSVFMIVGVVLCFLNCSRQQTVEQQTHINKDFWTQQVVFDLHHKSLQPKKNFSYTCTRTLTWPQIHRFMCPCTLHTLKKHSVSTCFLLLATLIQPNPKVICVDPALISSFLATYRGSTKLKFESIFFWLHNSAEHELNLRVLCTTPFLSSFIFHILKFWQAAVVVLTLQWACFKFVKRT